MPQTLQSLQAKGLSEAQARQFVSQLVDSQSTALATGSIFVTAAMVFATRAGNLVNDDDNNHFSDVFIARGVGDVLFADGLEAVP